MFDYWIIIEGHAKNGGSTEWCNDLTLPVNSTDGTCEYLSKLMDEHKKVFYVQAKNYWRSKDEQVNMAISIVRDITSKCYLWQVDADEHWTLDDLKTAEHRLSLSGYKQGDVQFNHYVGEDRIAVGEWGSGFVTRLFIWSGEKFKTHEPPRLRGHVMSYSLEGIKFDHYSYYFAKDIILKEPYYGYKGLLDNWLTLQKSEKESEPITSLFKDPELWITNSQTTLVKLRR